MTATLTPSEAMEKLDQFAHRQEAEVKAAKAMTKAKTRLVLGKDSTSVFFGSLAMNLKYAPLWELDTASVDGVNLVYNPDFVLSLSHEALTGLLAHEVLHCTNKHPLRLGTRDQPTFNIAGDLAINSLLIDAKFTLPAGGMFAGQGPYNDMPPGLSAEEYYVLLRDDQDKPGDQPSNDPGGSGGFSEPHKDDGSAADSFQLQQLEREWQANVAAAQQAAEKRGALPGGIARLCAKALAPVRDWKAELREYITQTAKSGYTWKRPNRRHVARGFYLPSLRSQTLGHIVISIDTSGSIGTSTIARFTSEACDIARNASRLTVIYHHSAVYRAQEWTEADGDLVIDGLESGGTSHVPVFAHIAEMDEPPEVVVCLTDCQSDFPTEPDYPVLFACTSESTPHPWGARLDLPGE